MKRRLQVLKFSVILIFFEGFSLVDCFALVPELPVRVFSESLPLEINSPVRVSVHGIAYLRSYLRWLARPPLQWERTHPYPWPNFATCAETIYLAPQPPQRAFILEVVCSLFFSFVFFFLFVWAGSPLLHFFVSVRFALSTSRRPVDRVTDCNNETYHPAIRPTGVAGPRRRFRCSNPEGFPNIPRYLTLESEAM
jgi:hypothetical protein